MIYAYLFNKLYIILPDNNDKCCNTYSLACCKSSLTNILVVVSPILLLLFQLSIAIIDILLSFITENNVLP